MLVHDPNTETIILFLETLRNSNEVAEMSRMAHAAGKQIICYKLGKSELGKELAKSHTGAIAGNDDAFNAFINYHGIARVETFETLIEIPNLFKNKKKPESKRVGIVTTTGGGGAMVVESLSENDIEIVDPGLSIKKIMQENNIAFDNNKLVDLTIAGTKPEIVNEVISQMMKNKNCDLVVMVVGSSAKFRPEQAVEPLLKWANHSKPLAVYVAPDAPEALTLLHKNNIACFRTPESCAESVKTFLNTKNPVKQKILKNDLSNISKKLKKNISKNLSEEEALEIFKDIGIQIVDYKVSFNEKQAIEHSSQIGFPLAMKVLSNKILHKTETGGVELNIKNLDELKTSFQKLSDVFQKLKMKSSDEKFLIQKMEKGIAEIILGYRVDELVGPIVVLGSGGILSEIYNDKSIRMAPVDITEAKKMINEVKSLVTITGYRGLPEADINIIANAVVNMSKFAFVREIKEAEINPVIVKKENEGIVAVDGLITLN
jgi:acyl-CoA synthetase (NDP forming)